LIIFSIQKSTIWANAVDKAKDKKNEYKYKYLTEATDHFK